MKSSSKRNIIFVVVLFMAAIAVFAVVTALGSSSSSSYAVVHDGDGGETTIELGKNSTTTITTSLGTNVVVVEGGEVYVSDADCPNHDCIQQGRISTSAQQIVCLPHKLYVEIVGVEPEEGTADVVGR